MLVIDFGGILAFIFWTFVAAGAIWLVVVIIGGFLDSTSDTVKSIKHAYAERVQLLDIFKEMGLEGIGMIDASVNRRAFSSAMKIYYGRMRELVEVKEELQPLEKFSADKLATSFFQYTNLDPCLRKIVDYRVAYAKSLASLVGVQNAKKSPDHESVITYGTTKIVVKRTGNHSYGYDDETYSREIEVFSGAKKVLDISVRGEIYDTKEDYFFTVFKPEAWIIDINELAEKFQVLMDAEKEEQVQDRKASNYL